MSRFAEVVSDGGSSWTPIDLGAVIDGEDTPIEPGLLARSDGQFLLYAGMINVINGEPEAGKSWLAMKTCAQLLLDGDTAMYLDFEGAARIAVQRLRTLGVPDDLIRAHFVYVRPDDAFDSASDTALRDAIRALVPALVVLDGITEAMALFGYSILDNDDVAQFMRRLVQPLTDLDAAVLLLDHVGKDMSSRGRWGIGAQHKFARADLVYALRGVSSFGKGRSGSSLLELKKDRHGAVREIAWHQGSVELVASVRFLVDGDCIDVVIDVPSPELFASSRAPAGDEGAPDSMLLERLSKFVEQHGVVSSKTALRTAGGAKKERVDIAIAQLVEDAILSETPVGVRSDGSPSRCEYRSLRPYRTDTEPQAGPGEPEDGGA